MLLSDVVLDDDFSDEEAWSSWGFNRHGVLVDYAPVFDMIEEEEIVSYLQEVKGVLLTEFEAVSILRYPEEKVSADVLMDVFVDSGRNAGFSLRLF